MTILAAGQPPSLVPLYRLYKSSDRDHFYRTCLNEKDKAVIQDGYNYEKIEAYIYDLPFQDVVPLYRLYNSTTTSHYYTTSTSERQNAINSGYRDEGIAGYVYPIQRENTVPMYHLELESVTDHFYTISEFERDNAVNRLYYRNWGIAMYVSRNSQGAPLAGRPVGEYGNVDLSSGNFHPYYNHIDFANPTGIGLPFVFARTYNAMNAGDSGPLGPGWDHSYNIRIIEDVSVEGAFIFVKWGDGKVDKYKLNGTTYEPYCLINDVPSKYCGIYDTLTKPGSTFILTKKDLTKYIFDLSNGRLLIEDKNGNISTITYDSNGNINMVKDGSGRDYQFTYYDLASQVPGTENLTESNRYRLFEVVEQDASLHRSFRFGYDAKGNLIKFWDAENNLTQYEYNHPDNLLTKIILPKLNEWTADYDNKGRVSIYTFGKSTDTIKEVANFVYDDPISGTIVNIPVAGQVQTTSCTHNNFKVQSCKDGANNISDAQYGDPFNPLMPTQVKDKNNNTWNYTYNAKGNILTSTTPSPLNETTYYDYDASGLLLTKVKDPSNNVTRYEYDQKGNLWKIINEDVIDGIKYDRVTEISRYPNGLVWIVTDPRLNTTTYTYEYASAPSNYITKMTVTNHLGNSTIYDYDAGGRLLKITDADGITNTYTYDNLNSVKTVRDHQGKLTTHNYDANGNLESIDDPRPTVNEKIYSYNNRDLLETVTESNIIMATQGYDEIGRLTSIKNAKNRIWGFEYAAASNLKEKTTPLGFFDEYPSYDGNGNLKSYNDRLGRTFTYGYDEANRRKSISLLPSLQYSFGYWPNGLLQSASAGTGRTNTFEYTSLNKVKKYTDPFNNIVTYSYNEAGNLKTISFNGKTVIYGYDARNFLTSVSDWLGRTTQYFYKPSGRLERILYPNNAYIEYIYDAYGRLQELNNKKPDHTCIVCYKVDVFDELDAPKQITTSGGIDHLIQQQSFSLTHDENNRINSPGFSYNDQGEILSKSVNGQSTTYEWYAGDIPGLLKKITKGSTIIEYSYDGQGNRISRTENGVTTRYVLDMSGDMVNVIAETDSSSNVTAYYIYGLGLITKILPDNTAKYYHYDRIGNTVALTDSNGNVTDQYAYTSDPYGISVTSQGSTPNPFKFIGQHGVMDDGNNLYYMRARFYDAGVGRFLSEDPLGFEGGDWNLYAYVGGNPVTGIDPEGLQVEQVTAYDIVKNVLKWPVSSFNKSLKNIKTEKEKVSKGYADLFKNIKYGKWQEALSIARSLQAGTYPKKPSVDIYTLTQNIIKSKIKEYKDLYQNIKEGNWEGVIEYIGARVGMKAIGL